ncbi:MAG: hypothetical protein M1839_002181 [Geoglossum umbratile]|nr:MAG: hypothetical protein M1839_002181 [Geoglossum umbratile]
MSSPTASSDFGSSVNNPAESYSSSRTSSSMTLASPSPFYNQNDMSPFSNDRPSLARQIEMDKWREKTREMIARVQREEDERVRAYRERYGHGTAESGSGPASRRDSDTEEGRSQPTRLRNSSPPTMGQTRPSRERSSTSSTAPLRIGFPTKNQDDSESDLQQRETPPRPPVIGINRASTPLCDDVLAMPPSVPPKIPQGGAELSSTHPGGSQRGGNNPFAEVDKFIGGFDMYDRQERAHNEPKTPNSSQSNGPAWGLNGASPTGGERTSTQAPELDWRPQWTEAPSAAELSATNGPHTFPHELDSAPIVELSAQLSVRRRPLLAPECWPPPPQRHGTQPGQAQSTYAQFETQAHRGNQKPLPAPPPKKQHLKQYAADRKSMENGSGGVVMPVVEQQVVANGSGGATTSVAEQQAATAGGGMQSQREKLERDRERDIDRMGYAVEGLALRKFFDPRIRER